VLERNEDKGLNVSEDLQRIPKTGTFISGHSEFLFRYETRAVLGIANAHNARLDLLYDLIFKNPASYIKDGHTATLNTPHFL
jgi:hypothetical protein